MMARKQAKPDLRLLQPALAKDLLVYDVPQLVRQSARVVLRLGSPQRVELPLQMTAIRIEVVTLFRLCAWTSTGSKVKPRPDGWDTSGVGGLASTHVEKFAVCPGPGICEFIVQAAGCVFNLARLVVATVSLSV